MGNNPDDLLVWPDGGHCFRFEAEEFSHRGDDFEVVAEGSERYESILHSAG